MAEHKHSKIKARIIVFGFFLFGIISGASLMNIIAAKVKTSGSTMDKKLTFSDAIQSEVGITPDQRQVIDQIMEKHKQGMTKIMQEVQPQIDQLKNDTRRQIRATLSDQQQVRFDLFIKKKDEEKLKTQLASPAPRK